MSTNRSADTRADKSADKSTVTGLPHGDEPVFREPWEAQAFALVVALHRQGLFTWPEWAAALAAQIKTAQAEGDADHGDTYYRHWLAALERLVASKGAGSVEELAGCQLAWERAAHRTRHGEPIELREADFSPGTGAKVLSPNLPHRHR